MIDILQCHYTSKPGIAIRQIKNEIFFISPSSAELHSLNENGVVIWNLVQKGLTPNQIIDQLIHETDGAPDVVRADLIELFMRFIEKGILQAVDE